MRIASHARYTSMNQWRLPGVARHAFSWATMRLHFPPSRAVLLPHHHISAAGNPSPSIYALIGYQRAKNSLQDGPSISKFTQEVSRATRRGPCSAKACRHGFNYATKGRGLFNLFCRTCSAEGRSRFACTGSPLHTQLCSLYSAFRSS